MAKIFRALAVPVLIAALGVTGPVSARTATARLVTCDAGDCLLVRGKRPSAEAAIRINDHVVQVEGRRSWQVRVPVATIQDWSAPFARTLRISTVETVGSAEQRDLIRLPVGLLAHNVELASLVVRAR